MSDGIEEGLRGVIAEWRRRPKRGCTLAEPFDPASDHLVGDPGAPIAVVEYMCYGWPAAMQHERAVRAGLRDLLLAGRICVAVRHFPVVDSSPHALLAALAVESAALQGRFWDLHEAISIRIAEDRAAGSLRWRELAAFAQQRGIDVERLEQGIATEVVEERVLRDFGSGARSGVNSTPSFYVDGIRQIVDRPEELVARIEKALAGDRRALWPPVVNAGEAPPAPEARVALK